MKIHDLSDGELFSRLQRLGRLARRVEARRIVVLVEVERRRLDLRMACSSMFDFCQRKLAMSEGAAFRALTAARLVARFPRLLAYLESGAIHLTNLALLRDHLTEANLDELVGLASGKTKRQVEELIAARARGRMWRRACASCLRRDRGRSRLRRRSLRTSAVRPLRCPRRRQRRLRAGSSRSPKRATS